MDRIELADKLEAIVSMWPILGNHARATVKKAAAALRESEEWRRKAARYDWLTEAAYVGETFTHEGAVWEVHGTTREVPMYGEVDETIDAAIDAARKEGV
jgi:hypothetical protein